MYSPPKSLIPRSASATLKFLLICAARMISPASDACLIAFLKFSRTLWRSPNMRETKPSSFYRSADETLLPKDVRPTYTIRTLRQLPLLLQRIRDTEVHL